MTDAVVTVKSSAAWTVNHLYAERYQQGRVFCAGDAVHRHPPSNGPGSNTSILKLVLSGAAGPGLLDSYTEERAPVGRQIVERANRSIGETGRIFQALGLLSTEDPEQMQANMAARKLPGGAQEKQRELLREAIAFKDYEFNTHGVELDQRYRSAAVVPDGAQPPVNPRDDELFHHPTTWPGAKVPHAWLGRGTERVSTLDVGGGGRFALLTGIGGESWVAAAGAAATALGIELAAVTVGPGADYEDLYGDWARLREVGDTGCVLLRPDNYVAYRSAGLPDDPAAALGAALRQILARDGAS